ncbi:MAG: hypothetical protein IKY78_00445 [Clostridia bacterium]|nr:hypothetical protein [Clostridia bacterium]
MADIPFEWLPLDIAGQVFPGQNSKKWANVYRLTVCLDREIDPEKLKVALESTLDRIPTLKVRMRNGFFHNYFEVNRETCPIRHDIRNFCYRIDYKENNGYLLRVYYNGCRISVDFYHVLCDGNGASVFIFTLAGEYLRLEGLDIATNNFVLDVSKAISSEEAEDAYLRYCGKKAGASLTDPTAYHRKGTPMAAHNCNYTTVYMSFSELHSLSKRYGVTVTELFASVMLDVMLKKQRLEGKVRHPVSVQIPVNLRKFFPSSTLRNFVLCVLVSIDGRKKEYTFTEILESVSSQLRRINNKDAHGSYINSTVKLGYKAIRPVPRAIKNMIVKAGFLFGAEYSTSVLISNLGAVSLPDSMKEHTKSLVFYTGPGLVNGARCGVACIGDTLAYTFSNRYKEDDIERDFLLKLSELGIKTTVETNRDTDFSTLEGVTSGDSYAYSDELFIPTKKDRAKLPKYTVSLAERLKRYFSF